MLPHETIDLSPFAPFAIVIICNRNPIKNYDDRKGIPHNGAEMNDNHSWSINHLRL